MLTEEENNLLCRVEGDAPMGQIMRRHWMPACLSEELPEPDGAPVAVRLLGEDLVAWRGTDGRVGLTDRHCAHRRASLVLARNEENSLRCLYHGWKFNIDGRIVEMPSEPTQSALAQKLKITAYSTHEFGGIVWAYLGPRETMPAFEPPAFVPVPDTKVSIVKIQVDCNWAQVLEGNIDSAHSSSLHSSNILPAVVDGTLYNGMTNFRPVRRTTRMSSQAPLGFGAVRTLDLLPVMWLCAAVWLQPLVALSQAFPTKPIKVVAPFPPGSGPDTIVRMLGARIGESMGQPLVIENNGGANGTIGAAQVARAAPDGYTVIFGNASTHVTSILMTKNTPYDPVKDFTPITIAVEPVTCIAVNASLPVNSIAELVDYAKRNPGKVSYSTPGVGAVFHFTSEIFRMRAGIDIVHVPYKGLAPAVADLVAGRVQMISSSVSDVMPHARAGKVRILGIMEGRRYSGLPDVPLVSDALPGFEKPGSWHAFLGPAGMPQSLVTRWRDEINKAINIPEVRTRLIDMGMTPIGSTPEQFAAAMKSALTEFGRVMKTVGIQPE